MVSYDCKFLSPWVAEGTKILMQVFFVVSFLSLFFFLYVVKVEKEQFVTQVNLIVDNIMGDLKSVVSQIVRNPHEREKLGKILKNMVNNWEMPQREFENIKKNNEKLLEKTKNIVITFAVILVSCLVTLMILHFCLHLTKGFIENITILVFIGLTELTFLTVVASHFIAADPNKVKYAILNSIEEFSIRKSLEKGQTMPNFPQFL